MSRTTKQNRISSIRTETPDKKREEILKSLTTKSNAYWMREREKNMLDVFHRAAKDVPAYKDFLKKHKVDSSKIKTLKDFQDNVPVMTKENYLKKYPLEKLSWDGNLQKPLVFTSTSGSTGEPFYFARNHNVDWQSSLIHEIFFKNAISQKDKSTLVVVCFGMGVWIGGLITYQAFEIIGENGFPVSIITPGINKEEIFKALKKLAPSFSQVILAGYPPFIKDILDESLDRGIDLKKLNIKLIFAAEAFTERFRDYVVDKVKIKNPHTETMNIYGSADIGTMAFETPLSILIRRIAVKKPKLFEKIFDSTQNTPTLAQYIPQFINFESQSKDIILTGDNTVPLIRYSIGDRGGTFSFNELNSKFASSGVSLYKEAKKAGIEKDLYQLPFVFIRERKDLSVTLYGLQIYPETIREVLLEKPYDKFFSGKLTLITKFDENQDQYVEINLEARKGIKIEHAIEIKLLDDIVKNLRSKNSEFRELSDFLKGRATPKLVFWPFEDPLYFGVGIKQSWVKR